jgi:ABC-type lipoprotein release transport system permease subunit
MIGIGLLMQRVTSLLYKPGAADAAYAVAAMLVLLLCALWATMVPAGRASRVSPIDAIRTE